MKVRLRNNLNSANVATNMIQIQDNEEQADRLSIYSNDSGIILCYYTLHNIYGRAHRLGIMYNKHSRCIIMFRR